MVKLKKNIIRRCGKCHAVLNKGQRVCHWCGSKKSKRSKETFTLWADKVKVKTIKPKTKLRVNKKMVKKKKMKTIWEDTNPTRRFKPVSKAVFNKKFRKQLRATKVERIRVVSRGKKTVTVETKDFQGVKLKTTVPRPGRNLNKVQLRVISLINKLRTKQIRR